MSIIVNLKDSKRASRTSSNADLVALQMDYIAAHEDLMGAGLALSALTKTERDLEKAEEFSGAIAQKDSQLASVVAHEMVSLALANIGQDVYADEIAPAHEDVTVAQEGIKDTIKNVWAKIKEYALKVWNFIRNLIIKAVDFVKGLFGKNGSSTAELKDLVAKLQKDKRTNLEADEFDKATQERLAAKIPLVLIKEDKKLTDSEYVDFLNTMDKIQSSTTVIENTGDTAFTVKTALTTNGLKDFDALAKASEAVFGVETNGFESKFISVDSVSEEPWKTLKDYVEDKVKDYDGGLFQAVGLKDNKATFLVLAVKDNFVEAQKEFNTEAAKGTGRDLSKVRSAISTMFNNLEVLTITVNPEKIDYADSADNVIPLDFTSLENVSKKLEDLSKKADSKADKIKNSVEKKAKQVDKDLTTVEKEFDKDSESKTDDDEKRLIEINKLISQKRVALATNAARIAAQGRAETLLGIARNSIVDVCKESARLYKKTK